MLDSSALAGQLLSRIIQEDPRFAVAGIYPRFSVLADSLTQDRLHVLVADFSDEQEDPAELVRRIAADGKGPLVLVLANEGWANAERLQAMRGAGMSNHILRPANVFELERIGRQILTNAWAAWMIRKASNHGVEDPEDHHDPDLKPPQPSAPAPEERVALRTLVLAYGGRGGLASLEQVLRHAHKGPTRILLAVVHDTRQATVDDLCRLSELASQPVRFVVEGEKLAFGRIYLVQGGGDDLKIEVDRTTRSASLKFVEPLAADSVYTPSFDRLAAEAATIFGRGVSGMALSGSIPHGLAGLKAIQQKGGSTVGLAPEALEVPALVKEARRIGLVQKLLGPDDLPEVFASPACAATTRR
ncbi:MAG: hypothetical protein HY815_29575 [Candidatus Riflebacteria bacterium]|nr:hypothetical protein [Candidatus Riflebacteria bacterium]